MAQVFVVSAAGSVIAFIIQDLGEPAIAGWVIQVRFPLIEIDVNLTMTGPSPHAKCAITASRSPVRRSGP